MNLNGLLERSQPETFLRRCRSRGRWQAAAPLRLRANLRHLTWQTQQVAAGDFSQRVDFLGAFSEAFNSMVTLKLATARDELTERNRQLADTCDELKTTQSQLLQQGKMASIGQLVAGVAHEINNPIGFVKSNLGSLGRYGENRVAFFAASEPLLPLHRQNYRNS